MCADARSRSAIRRPIASLKASPGAKVEAQTLDSRADTGVGMSAAAPSGDLATAAAAFLHSNGGQPCKLSTLRRHLLDAALGGSEQQQQAWLKTFLCQNSGRFAVDAKGHVRLSDISMAFDSEPEPEPGPEPAPEPEPGPEPEPEPEPELGGTVW